MSSRIPIVLAVALCGNACSHTVRGQSWSVPPYPTAPQMSAARATANRTAYAAAPLVPFDATPAAEPAFDSPNQESPPSCPSGSVDAVVDYVHESPEAYDGSTPQTYEVEASGVVRNESTGYVRWNGLNVEDGQGDLISTESEGVLGPGQKNSWDASGTWTQYESFGPLRVTASIDSWYWLDAPAGCPLGSQ